MRHRISLLISLLLGIPFLLVLPGSPAHAAAPAPVSSVPVPFAGQPVTLSGNIGTPVGRTVILQAYSSRWSTFKTGQTDAAGAYSFTASTTASSRKFRVYAPAQGGLASVYSDVITLKTQKDLVTLKLARYGNVLRATGAASPVIGGRLFVLQHKASTGWVPVGDPAAESSTGAVQIQVPVNGSTSYRLVGEPVTGSPGAISSSVSFSASPAVLGRNVVYVTTESGGTPTTKGRDYPGSAILVSESGGVTTVSPSYELETIAVRGNSSATKPKKPYKIKFEEKQKPFGMKSDRTWILLANYQDWTLIRSRIAFELGRLQTGLTWTPSEVFTELYINGKYLGSYQMIQSIKIDNNRVDVDKENGYVIEIDPHWDEDGVPGFVGPSGLDFASKDPDERKELDDGTDDPEGITDVKWNAVKQKIINLEKVIYGADKKKDWSKVDLATLDPKDDWMTYLDRDSAVDYILTREFTKDNDADFYRSNFFSTNDVFDLTAFDPTSKFFMGPIWDFDRSAGAHSASSTRIHLPTGWWTKGGGSVNHDTNTIHWFTRIWKDPRFVAAVKARWADKRADYKAVAVSRVDAAVADLGLVVAVNDRVRWSGSGSRYAAKASNSATEAGFLKEIAWVTKWYKDRYNWMDAQLSAVPDPIP